MLESARIKLATVICLFGICLAGSYFFLPAIWERVDAAVFFFFNKRLLPGSFFLTLVAYRNIRLFDVVAFLFMGGLYFYFFRKEDNAGKRRLIGLGLSMLLIAVAIKQCGNVLAISHKSPTLVFENVNRLPKLTHVVTKDASRNSFPGDHGMMLMIFAAYVARYFGARAFAAAACIVVVFAMPRIASGAHWFSDVYMGSLAIVCIIVSWVLLTPLIDRLAGFFERFLPARLFPVKGKKEAQRER